MCNTFIQNIKTGKEAMNQLRVLHQHISHYPPTLQDMQKHNGLHSAGAEVMLYYE